MKIELEKNERIKIGIEKSELMKKKGLKCVYCNCTNPLLLTIDHKIPKAQGGTDDESNLQVCCWFCNQLKDRLLHQDFKKYYKSLISLWELKKVKLALPDHINVLFFPGFRPIKVKELK